MLGSSGSGKFSYENFRNGESFAENRVLRFLNQPREIAAYRTLGLEPVRMFDANYSVWSHKNGKRILSTFLCFISITSKFMCIFLIIFSEEILVFGTVVDFHHRGALSRAQTGLRWKKPEKYDNFFFCYCWIISTFGNLLYRPCSWSCTQTSKRNTWLLHEAAEPKIIRCFHENI